MASPTDERALLEHGDVAALTEIISRKSPSAIALRAVLDELGPRRG